MNSNRWLWLGVPVVCAALLAWLGVPHLTSLPQRTAEKKTEPVAMPTLLVGSASCSARSCHGGIDVSANLLLSERNPDKCLQNEYTRWTQDLHGNAYHVLFGERSQRMMKLLGGGKAHEEPRCLACHTNPVVVELPKDNPLCEQERLFGVGCEACHGNASKWLVPHTSPLWRSKSPEEKWDTYGMKPVTDPARLAQTCTGCHVGAPAEKGLPVRDMNHDFIAAGHPRLNFEFNSFLANMPPHWREDPKKTKTEAHLWAVGQIASAQAALELLRHRAADKQAPWPEFAEYDCFACHHSLADQRWRQTKTNGKPGTIPWGTWYYPLAGQLLGAEPVDLKKNMQRPLPDRQKVAEQARAAHAKFQALLAKLAGPKNDQGDKLARERIFEPLRNGSLPIARGWDYAEQAYLSLFAFELSHPDKGTNEVLEKLGPMRGFAKEFDGPTSSFDPDAFLQVMQSLRTRKD